MLGVNDSLIQHETLDALNYAEAIIRDIRHLDIPLDMSDRVDRTNSASVILACTKAIVNEIAALHYCLQSQQ